MKDKICEHCEMGKITNVKELEQWFNENAHELLCLDCETTSLKYMELELESIQLYNGVNSCYIEPHLINEMQRFINGVKFLVGHNLVFDLKVLHKYNISVEHLKFYDTMIAEHLLDENNKHIGLKDLSAKKLGKESVLKWEEARKKGLDSKEWLTYCINDVVWCWELMEQQIPDLESQGLKTLFREIEMPFLLCLLDMEVNGFLVDKHKISTTTKELVKEKESLEVRMLQYLKISYDMQITLTGESIITSTTNFNSSHQLGKILFEDLGLSVVETTPTGKPSVGKLTIIKHKDHPFVQLLTKYKICSKLLSGFFIPMPDFIDTDGRIRPSFNDCGTVTGRLSCIAKGTKIQTVRDFSKEPEGKNIEDIKQGDYIYCSDSEGELKVRKVKRLINNGKRECIKLKWQSVSNKFDGELIITPEHKIKTMEDEWVEASKIPTISVSDINRNRRLSIGYAGLDSRVYALHFQLNDYAYIYYPGMRKVKNIRFLKNALTPQEHVHHIDGNKLNDTYNNLHRMSAKEHTSLHSQTSGFKDLKIQTKAQETLRVMREKGEIDCSRPLTEWTKEYCLQIANKNKGMIKYIIQNEHHDYETITREMKRNNIDLKEIKKLYEETNHYIIGREDAGTYQVYDLEIDCMPGEDTHNFFANEICVHNCSKPNLQQLPAKNKAFPISTRECFISPVGKKIVTCDYSGQEIRVMAEISQDPALIKSLNDGQDLHLATANTMFDLGIEEENLYKGGKDYDEIKEKYDRERHNAKCIVFGLCYGKGAYGFSKDFGIPEQEAQVMVDKFFNTYPKLKESIDATHNEIKSSGGVSSLTGRKRRFHKETRKDAEGNVYCCYPSHAYRQSFNFLIQGLSADMMRIAATLVRQNVKPEWEVKHIATVHDEHVYECTERFIKEFSQCLKDSFKNALTLTVELKSDVGVGNSYEEAK